jgi:CDP-paratose 2-epimerase
MYEHVLITGGAGFIGSSVAIALKKSVPGIRVTAFDNLHRRGSEFNVRRLADAGVGFVHGDVRLSEDLRRLPPPELVIECSAEPSAVAGYGASPEYVINTNVNGCFQCLELARRSKSDFIFLSTSRVYPFGLLNGLDFVEEETRFSLKSGQELPGASELGISEDFPLTGPRSLYGMTKLASELMIQEYGDAYGIRFIINRCGLVTGPWQMGKCDQGVIAYWLAAHYFRRELRYFGFGGSGKQVRDVLHVDDLCGLLLSQMQDFDRYGGSILNVGGGPAGSLSLRELTALCRDITGNSVPVLSSGDERVSDVRIYVTDHRRVTGLDGWGPRRDTAATLSGVYEWIRAAESCIKPILLGDWG